tara:strand:- start:61467 stop:62024 length:558 start_codon:yes stop_codon:yes gene_type:complete
MKNENQVKQINAIQSVKVASNKALITSAATRCALDKTSEKVAKILVNFCLSVSETDVKICNDSDIVQRNAYAIQKVTSTLKACKMKLSDVLDTYTQAFIFNANKRASKTLTNEEQNAVALTVESEKRRASDKSLQVSASTITTQRSSSCYALEACSLVKYDKHDKLIVLDVKNEHVARFVKQLKK